MFPNDPTPLVASFRSRCALCEFATVLLFDCRCRRVFGNFEVKHQVLIEELLKNGAPELIAETAEGERLGVHTVHSE